MEYVNYQAWNKKYIITVPNVIFAKDSDVSFAVCADCIQDAVFYLIDYCEENYPGLIMTESEEKEEEFLDDYINGGNHGRYLNVFACDIHVREVYNENYNGGT